jgi:hypothetical protein
MACCLKRILKMNNYIATRNRAYWVEETMYVEAESVEEAEQIFYNDFFVTGHTLPDRIPCPVELVIDQPVADKETDRITDLVVKEISCGNIL